MVSNGMGGLAYSNPYSAAIMAGASVVDGVMASTPMQTDSGRGLFDQHFDGSGWTVATGGSDARAVPTVTSALQNTAANALGMLNNPFVLIALTLVAVEFAKRSK